MLAQRCPGLQVLNVGGCSRVTDVGVAALAAGCAALRELDLSYNNRLSDAAVDSLAGVLRFPIAIAASPHFLGVLSRLPLTGARHSTQGWSRSSFSDWTTAVEWRCRRWRGS
jgi:hypothetical protein